MREIAGIIVVILVAVSTPLMGIALSVEERIEAQRTIERVYYDQRIWPEENQQPKPPFETMVPEEVIQNKMKDYLLKSAALDLLWNRPISTEQLQAEKPLDGIDV